MGSDVRKSAGIGPKERKARSKIIGRNMMKKLIALGFSSAIALAMATGAQAEDKKQLAFVVNAASDFWKLAEAGVKKASELPNYERNQISGARQRCCKVLMDDCCRWHRDIMIRRLIQTSSMRSIALPDRYRCLQLTAMRPTAIALLIWSSTRCWRASRLNCHQGFARAASAWAFGFLGP
jgi:hypothetical protein